MPVILAPEDWDRWLSTPEERRMLLKPFPASEMTMWPVSQAVGNIKNTGPELVEPVKPDQTSFASDRRTAAPRASASHVKHVPSPASIAAQ